MKIISIWTPLQLTKEIDMKKMLAVIACIMFLLPGLACAASNVTFEWDANCETDLAGYRLYQSQVSGDYTFGDGEQVATISVGTETVVITDIADGTYFWVLTAYDDAGNESGPSNEVTADLDTVGPESPTNVTITIIIKIQ